MGATRTLKRKKYTSDGMRIVKRSEKWDIVEDEITGVQEKRWHDGKSHPITTGNTGKHLINHPKANSNGFKQNPEGRKKGQETIANNREAALERQQKHLDGTLWRESQRECLRYLMQQPRGIVYAYMYQWGLEDIPTIAAMYKYNVTMDDIKQVKDEPEPTMTQTVSIRMVAEAQNDHRIGTKLLEILEGRAVSQTALSKEEEEAKKKAQDEVHDNQVAENEQLNHLAMLRKMIFEGESE